MSESNSYWCCHCEKAIVSEKEVNKCPFCQAGFMDLFPLEALREQGAILPESIKHGDDLGYPEKK